MKANWVRVAAALVAGMGIGLLAGKSGRENGNPDIVGRLDRPTMGGGQPSRGSRTRLGGPEDAGLRKLHASVSAAEEARLLGARSRPEDCADALEVYAEWARQDPHAAIMQAINLGEAGGHLRHRVMQVWARQDPAAAAEFFAGNRGGFAQLGRQEGMLGRLGSAAAVARVIVEEWGGRDPDAALCWARTLPDGDAALEIAVGAMAGQSPQRALDEMAGVEPEDQGRCLNEIARHWASKDFSGLREWIGQLPAGQQNAALGSALAGLAETDPARAVEELSGQLPAQVQQRLAGSLARAWSQLDPDAAAEWLKRPGNEAMRAMASGPVVEALARKDAGAAWQLVQAMGSGAAHDQSLSSYIRSQPQENPEKLLDLCASIQDEAARGQTIAAIIAQWSATDPRAAEAFRNERFSK